MRIIIPTRAYLPRMKAHRLFEHAKDRITFVVNNAVQAQTLREHFDNPRIVITGIPREDYGVCTISMVRQYISDFVLEDGEWALLLDDNVERVTRVNDDFYHLKRIVFDEYPLTTKAWRQVYATPVQGEELDALVEELKAKCIEQGTIFGGLAAEENYFYRPTKFTRVGYVKAKFAVYRNDRSLRWTPIPNPFEDYVMSAAVVAKYGSVVLNRFARMHNQYYEPGGIGSEEERREGLRTICKYLVMHYPGLVKYRPGFDWQLQFAIHHPTSIERWRKEHHAHLHHDVR